MKSLYYQASRVDYNPAFTNRLFFFGTELAIKGNPEEKDRKPKHHKTKEKDEPFWKDWINGIVNATTFTKTREGRAAEVHNMFRGLKLESNDGNINI